VNEDEAGDFIRTVSANRTPKKMIQDAEAMVRCVAERAIVATLAQHTADQFRLGQIDWTKARNRMQATLREMKAGILVSSVSPDDVTPPLAVRAAFLQVDQAQSGRNQAITAAETARTRVLGEAAGEASGTILSAVAYYERLLRRGEAERAARVHEALGRFYNGQFADACFKNVVESEPDPEARKQLKTWLKKVKVSGEAYDTIQKAEAEAISTRQAVSKEAEIFLNRLKQHRKNPRVLRDRLWQETLNQIFAGNAERFYLPPGEKEVYLEINRDPAIKKRMEREAYQAREKKASKK
jgi:regulator of protease activity HflC (stomatin/prohibitin superfamily)